ncbi:MAG: hypothetical protein JXB36_20600, partial [Gammaproteobacteria bacterium]|nr:hypothetical protein [Gammaproteobacteria bacterium]
DALNAQIAAELKRRAGDRDRQRDARDAVPAEPPGQDAAGTGVDGPQWYRGSVYCKPLLEEPVLDASLAALGAGRVIVGHTPTDDRRVRELYGGKLIMLDTGMLTEYYAGRPAALLIDRGDLRVQYVAPRERRPPEHGRPEAYGLTRLQLLTALAEGDVARDRAVRDGADGERRVTLSHGGRMLEAIFVQAGRAGAAEEELAAFAVDQLLRFDLVPPTVARALGSRDGALQLVYPDAVSEAQRRQDAIALADWCALEPQLQLLAAFDLLVANRAREADDVLFRPRYPELKAIDHERAFAGSRRLPPRLDDAAVAVPPPALASLEGLTQGSLERAAGRWLSERDIAAVLARRDALLDRLDGR